MIFPDEVFREFTALQRLFTNNLILRLVVSHELVHELIDKLFQLFMTMPYATWKPKSPLKEGYGVSCSTFIYIVEEDRIPHFSWHADHLINHPATYCIFNVDCLLKNNSSHFVPEVVQNFNFCSSNS